MVRGSAWGRWVRLCRPPARSLEGPGVARPQALEDHSIRHTRILEALEAEKQTLAEEVQALQCGRSGSGRDRTPAGARSPRGWPESPSCAESVLFPTLLTPACKPCERLL